MAKKQKVQKRKPQFIQSAGAVAGRISNMAKATASTMVGATVGLSMAATVVGLGEAGNSVYHYYTDTEMVKPHWWSKPVEVYCRNGEPVNSNGKGVK